LEREGEKERGGFRSFRNVGRGEKKGPSFVNIPRRRGQSSLIQRLVEGRLSRLFDKEGSEEKPGNLNTLAEGWTKDNARGVWKADSRESRLL